MFELVGRALLWFAGAWYVGQAAADAAADLVPDHPLFAALWVFVVWLPLWVGPGVVSYVFAVHPFMGRFSQGGEVRGR